MNFKVLNYKITKSTTADLATIFSRIISELDKPGYRIISETDTSIEFKYNNLRVGSRTEAFNRIDSGRFEIITGKDNLIVFSYRTYSLFEIIAILGLIISSVWVDYHIFIFVIVLFIIIMFRIISLKSLANEMLENIAGQPTV